MARIPDNYVKVTDRAAEFRREYGHKGSIVAKITLSTPDYIIISAEIGVDGKLMSVASACLLTADLSAEKAYEKAESSAIGRALQFAGYEALGAMPEMEHLKAVVVTPKNRRVVEDDEDEPVIKPTKAKRVVEDDEDDEPVVRQPKKEAVAESKPQSAAPASSYQNLLNKHAKKSVPVDEDDDM